ncbi:MAG: hypothetical protein JO121_18530 [Deltaproteobacteria bacterium]|nr:hypothetical protein [Deltaproteobacteria bacterium]
MSNIIEAALIFNLLGFALSIPCIIATTPITMCIFFFLGLPFFAVGFLLYAYSVFVDLRSHGVF